MFKSSNQLARNQVTNCPLLFGSCLVLYASESLEEQASTTKTNNPYSSFTARAVPGSLKNFHVNTGIEEVSK